MLRRSVLFCFHKEALVTAQALVVLIVFAIVIGCITLGLLLGFILGTAISNNPASGQEG